MPRLTSRYPFSCLLVAGLLYLSFFTVPDTQLKEVPFIDKWTHIAMYFVLGSSLWIEYLRSHPVRRYPHLLLIALALPVALGGLVELGQAYCTTHRSGDWLDFVANTLGALLATAAGLTLYRRLWRG